MADLYTQIKSALDKQVDKSPRIRALVYDKARDALTKKIEAFSPPLTTAQIAHQREKLENILADIEADYLEELTPPPAGLVVEETIDLNEEAVAMSAQEPLPLPSNESEDQYPQAASFGLAEEGAEDLDSFDSHISDESSDEEELSEDDNPFGFADEVNAIDEALAQQDGSDSLDYLTEDDNDDLIDNESEDEDPLTAAFGLPEETLAGDDLEDNDNYPYVLDENPISTASKKSRSSFVLIIILLLLLVGLIGVGYAMKDDLLNMLGISTSETSEISQFSETEADEAGASEEDSNVEQSTAADAIEGQVREIMPKPVIDGADSTASDIEGINGDDVLTDPISQLENSDSGSSANAPQAPQSLDAVEVNTSLFEQDIDTGDVVPYIGTAKWKLDVAVPQAVDQEATSTIRAELNLLEKRDMLVLMKIEKNIDPDLPASHTIEVVFDVPPDFPGGQVAKMGQITARSDHSRPPTPIQGLVQSVTDGYFLIALPNNPLEKQTNLKLLRDAPLLEIRIEYKTGQPGVLRIEKNEEVKKLFDEAFKNWGDI